MIGSAWLGSPWLRSQAAHPSTRAVALPFGRVVAVLPPLSRWPLVLVANVLVVWRLAICGVLWPPAQAASPSAAAASAASPPDRRHLVVRSRRRCSFPRLALSALRLAVMWSPLIS